MVGDSTIPEDFDKLMNGQKADMYMTDPPYILDYLNAKRGGKPTTDIGSKRIDDILKRKYCQITLLSFGCLILPSMPSQITAL